MILKRLVYIFISIACLSCSSRKCKEELNRKVEHWVKDKISLKKEFQIELKENRTNIFVYESAEIGSKILQELAMADFAITICELEKACLDKPLILNYLLPGSQFVDAVDTNWVGRVRKIEFHDCVSLRNTSITKERKLLKYITNNITSVNEQILTEVSVALTRLYGVGESTLSGLNAYFDYLNAKESDMMDFEESVQFWRVIALNKFIEDMNSDNMRHIDSINAIIGHPKVEMGWDDIELILLKNYSLS